MRLSDYRRRGKWRRQQRRNPRRSGFASIAIIFLAILAVLIIYNELAARLDAPKRADEIVGRATVVDGDTIRIGRDRIRLHGIDAPEKDQICKENGQSYRCGQRAKQALFNMVHNDIVRCQPKGRDRYKRIIAVCWSGETNLNSSMVSEGWALAYRKFSSDFLLQEVVASSLNHGIWKGDFVPPWDWRSGKR